MVKGRGLNIFFEREDESFRPRAERYTICISSWGVSKQRRLINSNNINQIIQVIFLERRRKFGEIL